MFEQAYISIVIALAVSAISVTISVAKVFESLRAWVARENQWLGKLISCPYCTSHWLTLGLVLVYKPRLLVLWLPLDLVITGFAIVAVAAFSTGLIVKAMDIVAGKPNQQTSSGELEIDEMLSRYGGSLDRVD